MNSLTPARMSHPASRVVVAMGLIVAVAAVLPGCGRQRVESYMAPYYRLARSGATEKQVVAREGRPWYVLANDSDLAAMAKRFEPYSDMPVHVESKVFVYPADPWRDGEGYVVYLFINKRGIVTRAVFGG